MVEVQTTQTLLKNKKAILTTAGFLFTITLCASTVLIVYGLPSNNNTFNIPIQVSGFKEKIRVELYTEKTTEIVTIDKVDHNFETFYTYTEGENIEVFVLTQVGIQLYYGNITASKDYTLFLTNSIQGTQANYLKV